MKRFSMISRILSVALTIVALSVAVSSGHAQTESMASGEASAGDEVGVFFRNGPILLEAESGGFLLVGPDDEDTTATVPVENVDGVAMNAIVLEQVARRYGSEGCDLAEFWITQEPYRKYFEPLLVPKATEVHSMSVTLLDLLQRYRASGESIGDFYTSTVTVTPGHDLDSVEKWTRFVTDARTEDYLEHSVSSCVMRPDSLRPALIELCDCPIVGGIIRRYGVGLHHISMVDPTMIDFVFTTPLPGSAFVGTDPESAAKHEAAVRMKLLGQLCSRATVAVNFRFVYGTDEKIFASYLQQTQEWVLFAIDPYGRDEDILQYGEENVAVIDGFLAKLAAYLTKPVPVELNPDGSVRPASGS